MYHNDKSAVGTCGKCGCGLCPECMQNATPMENLDKPACKNCAILLIRAYLDELAQISAQMTMKKVIWTIILVLGAGIILYNFFQYNAEPKPDNIFGIILGILVWALAGFTERGPRQVDTKQAMSEALLEHSNPWLSHFINLTFFLIRNLVRGCFFPFFYAHFMIMGAKELQEKRKLNEEVLANLENS